MGKAVNKMVIYLDVGEEWSELDKMKMCLGFQVLFHNAWMTAVILCMAGLMGALKEAIVLFLAFGLLKMKMGGFHFETSLACLLSTGTLVIGGSLLSRHMTFSIGIVVVIYIICIVIFWKVGPQETKNNPLSEQTYEKYKKSSMILSVGYLVVTMGMYIIWGRIPYLLFLAIVFETVTLLPKHGRYTQTEKC